MKKSGTIVWLLLVPVATLIYAVKLGLSFGPSGAPSPDGSYYYLMNALNLLEGHRIEHIDHPGTPVQAIGAITIATVSAVAGSGDAVRDVLEQPGIYVTSYFLVLMFLYACVLTAAGYAAWRYTNQLGAAVAIQAVPHLIGNESRLEPVSCECLLVSVAPLLAALMLRELREGPRSRFRALLLGVVIGFGTAIKMTFLPMALTPLLMLRGFGEVALFAGAISISFLLFTAPIWSEYPRLVRWVVDLATHQDRYGHGPQGLVPFSTWLANWQGLVIDNPLFSALLAIALAILLQRIVRWFRRGVILTASDRLLAGLVLSCVALFAITAKQPAAHYLAPARGTAGLLLWLVLERLPRFTRGTVDLLLRMCGIGAAAWMISIARPVGPSEDAAIQARLSERYAGWARVYYAGSSSVPYALHVGHWICGYHYTQALTERYPGVYHYHGWGGGISDWSGKEVDLAMLQKRHAGVVFVGGRLVDTSEGRFRSLFGYYDGSWRPPAAELNEVFRRGGEGIYEVVEN